MMYGNLFLVNVYLHDTTLRVGQHYERLKYKPADYHTEQG